MSDDVWKVTIPEDKLPECANCNGNKLACQFCLLSHSPKSGTYYIQNEELFGKLEFSPFWYSAECVRVVDGDTMDVKIDLGFKIYHVIRLRLLDVDTPETYGVPKESEEYKRGKEATRFVEDLVYEDDGLTSRPLHIHTVKDSTGKYGRYLAEVYVAPSDGEDPVCVNEALREAGHVK